MQENIIPCEIKKIDKKDGRYIQSYFWDIPEFVTKKWVVGMYFVLDYKKYLEQGKTEQEIVEGCINYINPPKKTRKKIKYKYDTLEYYKSYLKDNHIIALLTIDNQKNKHFVGTGVTSCNK